MEDIKKKQDRVLALGGVVLAASLVKQLAWKGSINQDEFATCVYSLFQTHAPTVPAVYGEGKKVMAGLRMLDNILSENKANKDPEIARYTLWLLHLERLLMKNPKMLNLVQRGIDRAKSQALHFSNTHENVIANLASVYTDSLSTLKFRIRVNGDETHLSSRANVNKIRTALLAGVRSAVLWRQLGGSRMQFIFGKRTLLQDVKNLIKELERMDSHAVT